MKNGKADRPNVIYILADDMGYGDISAYNEHCAFKTPHLDSLCQGGIRFTDAHASSAVCTPSRYSILTGRYNWRSRLKSSVIGGYSKPLIETGRKTIADLFRSQGYATAVIGKWHLGMEFTVSDDFVEAEDYQMSDGVDYRGRIKQSPLNYGFDYFYGISASLDMPPYIYIENDYFTNEPDRMSENSGKQFWRRGPQAPDFIHEEVLGTLTDKVCDKIAEYGDQPFFLYFPMPAPHTPILPTQQFRGKSGTNEYGDFVLQCDAVVGEIMEQLKRTGVDQNTIIIYTSDNGCSPSADYAQLKEAGHNPSYVFRGTKADIYEGGHRVPLIVRWPEQIAGPKVKDQLVCLSDFMATMAEYFQIRLPENMGEDSVSNLPLWITEGNREVREDLVHQSIDGSLSVRKGNFKLEMCPGSGGWSDPVPGFEAPGAPRFQLFDLAKDIGEMHNVIGRYPEIAKELTLLLKNYVFKGRSTAGKPQKNDGEQVWETIRWILEED